MRLDDLIGPRAGAPPPERPPKTHRGPKREGRIGATENLPEAAEFKPRKGTATIYTTELAATICARVANNESLARVCQEEGMPSKATVLGWIFKFPEFQRMYTLARETQAEGLVDEMVDIADDSSQDWMEKGKVDGNGVYFVPDRENINRSKLRMETRKWIASKLLQRYADRMTNIHEGGNKPIEVDSNGNNTRVRDAVLTLLRAEETWVPADPALPEPAPADADLVAAGRAAVEGLL